MRYLDIGEQYVVGAGTNSITKRLVSTVREPAPLFGGDQVVGVNDSDVDCPPFEDPTRTLTLQGTSVESGVLAPMIEDAFGAHAGTPDAGRVGVPRSRRDRSSEGPRLGGRA